MKDSMIEIMISMMPIMKPFMWAGAGMAAIGIALLLVQLLFKSNTGAGIMWASRLILLVSVFFLSAQAAGYYLSMPPTINFGDSSKFEFFLVSFWQIGLAFLVVAVVLKLVGRGTSRRQLS